MCTLILILTIIILALLDHFCCENVAIMGALVCVVIISGLMMLISCGFVISTYKIEEKIAMYEEENTAIEQSVSTVVQAYMEYESEIFDKITQNNESVMMFASRYPELKSNTLVQGQINIYVENNSKIKELKEEKITASIWRWLLYFGK
jgi:hypothetical protein